MTGAYSGRWSPFVREAVNKASRLDRVARMTEEAQERHADDMAWREAEAEAEEMDDLASERDFGSSGRL